MSTPNCFFGLQIEADKKYRQTPPEGVHLHLSQAALPLGAKGRASLKVTINDKTFCLCTLQAGVIDQCALDLNFSSSQEVCFMSEGAAVPIHITGYYEVSEEFPEDDEEDIAGWDNEGEEEEEELEDFDEEEEEEVAPPPKKQKQAPQPAAPVPPKQAPAAAAATEKKKKKKKNKHKAQE
eukprot:NODE_5466_length_650_cov_27.915870_g5302_i0.p1 GENE.NODE_5466_length_650_cov_27.915870_g5302_i0~~NODE_5466_length_650_cov_27.915870_g5302_i0.p1  ORF type:complete len:180 (-),score=67.09 NODE_5466_length_650_cov_27.915870_g5302_i0:48-587(-)